MKEILGRILNQEKLQRNETHDILLAITRGEIPDEQIAALLTAIQMRGITVDELLGFRDG
ncbi:MAG: anthranilate phosphoribosyltransferase, partial [Prevotella sp.]|nr:anthranilate phosphoribosyltransferase [Prevotella sp.]